MKTIVTLDRANVPYGYVGINAYGISSASYSSTSSYLSSDFLYEITSSWANNSISSSYSLTASNALNGYWIKTGSNIYYSNEYVGIGNINPTYSLQVSGTIAPSGDGIFSLGNPSNRFSDLYAVQTTIGAFFEVGLRTENIGKNSTGTIVVWKNGKLIPCEHEEDSLVMGVIKEGKDEPIILGAETILVTGHVEEGDYIVTSNKKGHGKAIKRGLFFKKDLFGKVIAQALESSNEESKLIKAMIRKM